MWRGFGGAVGPGRLPKMVAIDGRTVGNTENRTATAGSLPQNPMITDGRGQRPTISPELPTNVARLWGGRRAGPSAEDGGHRRPHGREYRKSDRHGRFPSPKPSDYGRPRPAADDFS